MTIFGEKMPMNEDEWRKYIKELGFESKKEFTHLVANIDLRGSVNLEKFLIWRETDGTKEGLLKIPQLSNKNP